MTKTSIAARRAAALSLGVALAATVAAAPVGARSGDSGELPDARAASFQGEEGAVPDVDARTGTVAPNAAQRRIAASMGATVRWNRFGTPHSMVNHRGYLATGLGRDAVTAARGFVDANRALFRLSERGVRRLELVNDSRLTKAAHVVLFRQRFGDLAAAQDGMLTVGVVAGKVAYVSSSIAGDGGTPPAATLTPQEAYRIAAADVGRAVDAGDIGTVRERDGWTTMTVDGFAQPQRARLVALPTVEDGVRPVYETIVVNSDARTGDVVAFTHFVDARTGKVWFRANRVQHLAAPSAGQFSGTTGPAGACGPRHPVEVAAGTKSIDVVASAVVPADDIVLNLLDPSGETVASTDTLFSPEAVHYAPGTDLDAGTYSIEVCPYEADAQPFEYGGVYATNDVAGGSYPYPPRWKVFPASPPLSYASSDTRQLWCWEQVTGCDRVVGNAAARAPWDFNVRAGVPTFTTSGNAANTAESWFNFIAPGPLGQRPVSLERDYSYPWTNQWNEERCNPAVFATPQRNDIEAATTNLFAMHNRMHDWSYELGFTERNYNLQDSNFGNGAPGPYPHGREADPEMGDAQAGAIQGGPPSYLGRDNANQITLNDGIPPITNMYLWQPIAGAFYPPCVDGDYDMSVIGHEYTHAISNRMVGGPDAGLSGPQAGAMGESWSDLTAVEYLHEHGFVPVANENPFAVGPYVTGDKRAGIRNYGMNFSPLNYSDVGYDLTGPQVHADGEIWSAVNYDIRRAMIKRYDAQYPASNDTLQVACAEGRINARQCPGNRRWMQIVFDAFLLMPSTVSMVDARDAYLAADRMRFGGANQDLLWREFARGGLGEHAASKTNADSDPTPSFESPLSRSEAVVTFDAVAADGAGGPVDAEIFVGHYEARATPVADTDPSTALGDRVRLVPGTYDFVARADGFGAKRFTLRLAAAETRAVSLSMPTNWASLHSGADVYGDGVNLESLVDDTEETNWASLGEQVEGREVTVDLAGGVRRVSAVQVSAMLRPTDRDNEADRGSQNRFSALRSFQILTCNAAEENCVRDSNFDVVYTSPDDAFPARRPRPRAPELILRTFDVADVDATHVRLRVLTNQCTGAPAYQGDQDDDPTNNPDCDEGNAYIVAPQAENVRAAELQVFSRMP